MLTPFCDGRGLGSSNVARHAKTKNGPTPKAMAMCMCSNSNPWHGSSQAWTTQIARNEAGTNKAKQFDHQRMCLIRKSHQPSVVRNQESQGIDRGTNIPMAHDHSFPAAPSTAITPRKRRYFCSDKVLLTCNSCNQQKYWTSKHSSQVSLAQVKGGPFLPGLMIKKYPFRMLRLVSIQVQLLTANYEWWLVRQRICRHHVFQTGVWLGIVEVEVESKLVRDPISSALAAMTFEYQEAADPAFSSYGLNKFSFVGPE